jgi:hypothetical protein
LSHSVNRLTRIKIKEKYINIQRKNSMEASVFKVYSSPRPLKAELFSPLASRFDWLASLFFRV